MVFIRPFQAVRYNPERIGDLSAVVAPPYDVIERPRQQALYDSHPANVVRLILNQETPGDIESNNVYTRAAGFFETWLSDQTLMQDPTPAMYAYSQSWQEGDQRIERKGLLALLRLDAYFPQGQVMPHEKILAQYVADRLILMKTVGAALSPIFMVYADPGRLLETSVYDSAAIPSTDWLTIEDSVEKVTHRFAAVTDTALIAPLQDLLKDKPTLIADGHHRYQTLLTLQQQVRAAILEETGKTPEPGSLATDYAMVFLTNLNDDGLQVYPTHRVLTCLPESVSLADFETALFKRYRACEASAQTFAYQTPAMEHPVFLAPATADLGKDLPVPMQELDVALLEETVFKGILNTDAETLKKQGMLRFYREEAAVETLLKEQAAEAVFWMQAPKMQSIMDVCEAGLLMPQKSTYFWPKLLSGITFYPYDGLAASVLGKISSPVGETCLAKP